MLTTNEKVTTSMYEGRSKGANVMAATMRMIICGRNRPNDNTRVLSLNHPIEAIIEATIDIEAVIAEVIEGLIEDMGKPPPPTPIPNEPNKPL